MARFLGLLGPTSGVMEKAKVGAEASFPSKRSTFEYDTATVGVSPSSSRRSSPKAKPPPDPLPCVLKGEGYGIVEDCGGVWGLAQLIDLVKRRAAGQPIEDTGYNEPRRLEWLDDFHPEAAEALLTPEAFDVAAANRALHPKPCPRPPAPPTKP